MPIIRYEQPKLEEKISFKSHDGTKRTIITDMYFLYQLFTKIKKGYSPTVAICGNQRIGKSFVGLWLCYSYMKVMGKKFKPETNTFYEPIKAIEHLEDKTKEAYLIDEAGDVLDAREWQKQTHQALKSIINTQAYKTMLYVFISPFIIDIDKAFRKHFDFMIRVDDRGTFKTFRFIKKYDELNSNKVIFRRFLDDVKINLKNVPAKLWIEYKEFSISEKEKIRKKRVQKAKSNDDDKDPIKRLAKMLR